MDFLILESGIAMDAARIGGADNFTQLPHLDYRLGQDAMLPQRNSRVTRPSTIGRAREGALSPRAEAASRSGSEFYCVQRANL